MPQAEARPAARCGRASRHRPGRKLHGRRSLARRRCRDRGRLPHRLHRLRLRRTRTATRPRRRRSQPRRGGRLDPEVRFAAADALARSYRVAESLHPFARKKSRMKTLSDLQVKIFADGADRAGMLSLYAKPFVQGFTTNPTLMRKAGISDYEAFARDIIEAIPDRSISLEVFSDEFGEMESQARQFAEWGENVYVKIPVTNTRRESSAKLCRRL